MNENEMKTEFSAIPENEGFARGVTAAFVMPLDPTVEELSEIKTAVSEAVTNAVIHGYRSRGGTIIMEGTIHNNTLEISVTDFGAGIYDISRAREPLYTGRPEDERSGMGFTIMETFTDNVDVFSEVGKGTRVVMTKAFGRCEPTR